MRDHTQRKVDRLVQVYLFIFIFTDVNNLTSVLLVKVRLSLAFNQNIYLGLNLH